MLTVFWRWMRAQGLRHQQRAADTRLAVHPYPRELERESGLADGRVLRLRPILPEDASALQQLFNRLTPEEIYPRFHGGMKVQHTLAARLTQIDYGREMALVLSSEAGVPGKAGIYAVARLAADPDYEHPEFSLPAQHDYAGQGMGTHLWLISPHC